MIMSTFTLFAACDDKCLLTEVAVLLGSLFLMISFCTFVTSITTGKPDGVIGVFFSPVLAIPVFMLIIYVVNFLGNLIS